HLRFNEGRPSATPTPAPAARSAGTDGDASELRRRLFDVERQRIISALENCGGNQTRAARLLGVSLRTLVNRLDQLGLPRPRKRTADGQAWPSRRCPSTCPARSARTGSSMLSVAVAWARFTAASIATPVRWRP